jgi:hypothetical protein
MNDLLKLLYQHEGGKAVTITVPFEKSPFVHNVNEAHVKSAIKKAGDELKKLGEDHKQISQNLDTILDQIDFSKPGEGIGIFVSSKIAKFTHYHLPVKERVIISEYFDTHDLIYSIQQIPNYYVLLLSGKHTRLYKGMGEQLQEIEDKNFPMHYTEEHQFDATPTFMSPGVEVSAVKEMREVQYLRRVDAKLSDYLLQDKLPIVLMGVVQHLSYFTQNTKHAALIAGEVRGNFDHILKDKIETLAFQEIAAYHKSQADKELLALKESIGGHLCVYGLRDVYKAATEGKGNILFVEKDFTAPGELNDNSFNLYEAEEGTVLEKTVIDVVTAVMEEVIKKGGKVHFVDNGELVDNGRIALLLRY